MKRNIRRIGKFILIFFPRNIYRILVHLYLIAVKEDTRTNQLIRVIREKNYNSYLEVGVWQGDNLLPIAKKFTGLPFYGVDPYSGSSYEDYYKGEIMALVVSEY